MRIPLVVALALFVAVSCDQQPIGPTNDAAAVEATPLFDANPILERVSVGGADVCEALGLPTGCDANFSLTAYLKADGSVGGQWQDTFEGGQEGIHVAIDCLHVIGNAAIVGGVITHGNFGGLDLNGWQAVAAVVDNGTSTNDPLDQISVSRFVGESPGGCMQLDLGDFSGQIFDLVHGQVKVK